MLNINNFRPEIEGKEILRSLTLAVNAGEVHAIMGPNGAGNFKPHRDIECERRA